MEYLQGESLSDRLKREKRIPLGQAMSIGAQIADALNASHQQGIIHRDLKPENIFLCTRGANREFVKVLDFGLAKLTQNDQKVTHKTRTGSVMGTPYYMSPEQCEGKTEIDYRADIYSLGVLIFEMLTGKVPFGGEGYGEIIVKHVTMPPPSVRSVVPELPEFMDPIMYRVLAKDRDQRFQTMADLREALLDPERYASSAPEIGIPDDLSGIARAAAPMARAELELRSALGHPSQILTPPPPGGTPSGRGELIENFDNLIRTRFGEPPRPAARAGLGGGRAVRGVRAPRHPPPAARREHAAPPGDRPRELQLRPRRRRRAAPRRQDPRPDAPVDRDRLQRLGGRVPVQETGLRAQDDVRRPQPPLAALRDAAARGHRTGRGRGRRRVDGRAVAGAGRARSRTRAAAAAAAAQTQQQHPPKDDEDGVLEPSIR